ncbi:MAG: SDR family NAD(P)-dependent oxidoreductase [Candidatus Marinimicrobia bacterium]|jgi:short-subunit dehydrogenase|nr:SDR family NAD(P)-dependent oxidoreductase [Candidatus Neomarinimicrobiota bacterium]MBT3634672.1 SDR family NAD(P)-dependent oxidoreductase [Candidatus Neomarinimicrobiota bacterium]MBT3682698.1 SDR family NAD(P)-dependent oxidoreductase [Candidatus Neomarinimicrobiota bacterium]MBT3759647.1 SDR family NAD(P)-dependent oxidoreductase [Candidatus Neomarinimicrobiota bacterium]MBT3894481.1 SDR family NAD(P)-dependent oxidoreductase [Candidatus Neomarinimicrobiota bacterium]
MQIFNDKVALITGASRGIGTYIAKSLAKRGCRIVAIARDKDKLSTLCQEIENQGGNASYIPLDLSEIHSIEPAINSLVDDGKRIDFLINNAGIEQYRHLQNYTADQISKIINVNLHAPIELTRILLPYMLENGGNIVNIASLGGKKGIAFNSIYSATKSGLIMWTDAMRQELNKTSVNISVVCPGFISEAGMFKDSNMEAPRLLGTSSPLDVVDAVIKCIEKNLAEVIVNKGPMKPLLSIGQLSPLLADRIVGMMGVREMSLRRVEAEKSTLK